MARTTRKLNKNWSNRYAIKAILGHVPGNPERLGSSKEFIRFEKRRHRRGDRRQSVKITQEAVNSFYEDCHLNNLDNLYMEQELSYYGDHYVDWDDYRRHDEFEDGDHYDDCDDYYLEDHLYDDYNDYIY